ncbi:hypothetical protein AAFF_G00329480 [Aldrovandia affinis]|uniref:Fibronectin type-III domain-containing protein n=1 Tax=Aldrovandia affinis TaxID=143900 RepID=A0AAD7WQ03_9TELE|nr:hypothetical protein AAFF_G00329480 [Aldrovandia affinis]
MGFSSHLMDMCLWTVVFLALCCTGHMTTSVSPLKARKNPVYFESRDFLNQLHWERKDEITGETFLYSVQYKIYGEEWKDKEECQKITTLFLPLQSTVLGPPDVSIFPGLKSLNLSVRLPKDLYDKPFVGDLISSPGLVLYTANLTYDNKTDKVEKNVSQILFNHLQNNREYRVSVRYIFPLNKQSEVFEVLVKTLNASASLDLFIIPALLASLILASFFLAFCQMFVRRKSLMPNSLDLLERQRPSPLLTFHAESTTTVEVCTGVTRVCVAGKRPAAQVGTLDSYTPQVCDPSDEPWHCQSYASRQGEPSAQSSSTQSSTNYSQLFIQRQGSGEGADRVPLTIGTETTDNAPQGWATKLDNPTPLGAAGTFASLLFQGAPLEPQLDHFSGEEPRGGTLVVPTFRRSDGALVVTSLFTCTQLGGEPGVASTAVGEVSLDNGVRGNEGGSSYLPNQAPPPSSAGPPPVWESCYCPPNTVPAWNTPMNGHAPSGYRPNEQEGVALLPTTLQDTGPSGGSAGGVEMFFPELWGIKVQE